LSRVFKKFVKIEKKVIMTFLAPSETKNKDGKGNFKLLEGGKVVSY